MQSGIEKPVSPGLPIANLLSLRYIRIKTRQLRRLRSARLGEVLIEHTYVDHPASLDTWIDHCGALAVEFGISALDVHTGLFAQLPEIFGR